MDILATTPILPLSSPGGIAASRAKKQNEAEIPFAEFLKQAFNDVNNLQKDAEEKIKEITSGNAGSFHDVIIATEKASLALELFTQIQNKLVEAYQEIMRLQL